ncbi:MAG: hypothetical protein U1E81_02090 [Xanthobacteraceae bacterium]
MTLRDNQPQTNFLRPKSNAAIINMPRRHLAILIVAKLSSRLSRYSAPAKIVPSANAEAAIANRH